MSVPVEGWGMNLELVPPADEPAVSPGQEEGQASEPDQEAPRLGQPLSEVEFEGQAVTAVEGKFPAFTVPMEDAYLRGTAVQVLTTYVLKNVHHVERKGEPLIRQQVFSVQSMQLVAAFDPAEAADDVGGSASGHAVPTAEQAEELGLQFRRSSDLWGSS